MSELDQQNKGYTSPNKLPSLLDLQYRQKQFNKLSAQRLSISKAQEAQQQQQQDIQQQQQQQQVSGKKYYQSRYIHSPGEALNYERSGVKEKEKELVVEQTPVSQFSLNQRSRAEQQLQYQQQQGQEMNEGIRQQQQQEMTLLETGKLQNEINLLRRLVGELQGKVEGKDVEVSQWKMRVGEMERDERELGKLVDELKVELALMKRQCMEREERVRMFEEERKREMESWEFMMKEKESQRVLEVEDLVQRLDIERRKNQMRREKYGMKVELVGEEVKKMRKMREEIERWVVDERRQGMMVGREVMGMVGEAIMKSEAWGWMVNRDKENELMDVVREGEIEAIGLNQRWEEILSQQLIEQQNEARNKLQLELGKLQTRIVGLEGQINDYQVNYMRMNEHKEVVRELERKRNEQLEREQRAKGELEVTVEDNEWRLQKEREENKALAEALVQMQNKWRESEKRGDEVDMRRVILEGKLQKEVQRAERLEKDIRELLSDLEIEKSKYVQNDEIKRLEQIEVLRKMYRIIELIENVEQREFEIRKLENEKEEREREREDRVKERDELIEKVELERENVMKRDARIRQMEIQHRQDLNNYFYENELISQVIKGLKQEKAVLGRHVEEIEKEHEQQMEKLQREKVAVMEELQRFIEQLNKRNNELRQEQRTVSDLLAVKKKLETIVANQSQKLEEMKEKIEQVQGELRKSEEQRAYLGKSFDEYKLQQLKRKKFELLGVKKLMGVLKSDYLSHQNTIQNIVDQGSSDLQQLTLSVEQSLNSLSVQYEQQLTILRENLVVTHSSDINQLLYQEQERSRVQLDAVRRQMGEEIIQLGQQLTTLKKKLQHQGGDKQILGQNLDTSEMVKRFSTQQLQDIQSRYLKLKSELDLIVSENKGKYQAIQQLHEKTNYTKEQLGQLKQFTSLQDTLSALLISLETLLKHFSEIDIQRDRDLKASQSLMQSKILSTTKQIQGQIEQQTLDIAYQLTDSFSPTQYEKRRQQQQQGFPGPEQEKTGQAINLQKFDE